MAVGPGEMESSVNTLMPCFLNPADETDVLLGSFKDYGLICHQGSI